MIDSSLRTRLAVVTALIAGMCTPAAASVLEPVSRQLATSIPYYNVEAPTGSTPDLIGSDVKSGAISDAQGWLHLAQAFARPSVLPDKYFGNVGWWGTVPLMNLRDAADRMPRAAADPIDDLVNDFGPDTGCGFVLFAPTLHTRVSDNFAIGYTWGGIRGGLTIDDYEDSLETSWIKEVDSFGWAAPPLQGAEYPVTVDSAMIPLLYGFVAQTGTAGNNPNTSWTESDARYSCMGLNGDYSGFPGSAQQALDATTAHEFNHSIQFGLGALSPSPGSAFVEGGATWMEDEVFDDSNDSYNYLHPNYAASMLTGSYQNFIIWRALTEPYGASVADGGEDVMQLAWEHLSKNNSNNVVTALNHATTTKAGINLNQSFHEASLRLRLFRPCDGSYPASLCLKEANGYRAAARAPSAHGSVTLNGSVSRSIAGNFASDWISLPVGSSYNVSTSGSGGGTTTLLCDTGTTASTSPASGVFNAASCQAAWAVSTSSVPPANYTLTLS